jgi:hypothetical protein
MMQSAVRAAWWVAFPLAFLLWLLGPREIDVSIVPEPSANMVWASAHALLLELEGGFRGTAVALALTIVVTVVSHLRRTRAVRTLSLLLPTYVAAYEACIHFSWFFRRYHYTMPPLTMFQLHHEYHLAGIASAIAVAAPLFVAVALSRWCRDGMSGGEAWPALAAVPPFASIVVLWFGFDQMIFRPALP